MTVKQLSQVYHLRAEIEEDRRRIRDIESRLLPGSPPLSGMPHGSGVKDKIGEGVPQLADLRSELQMNEVKCALGEKALLVYINRAEDSFIRRILKLRFYDGLSWEAVAGEIGGLNNADNIKHACYRYIKKH